MFTAPGRRGTQDCEGKCPYNVRRPHRQVSIRLRRINIDTGTYQGNNYQSNSRQNDGPLKPSTNQPRQELPDRKRSKNPFVNGSRIYSKANDGLLCVRCGTLGKRAGDGHDCRPLPAWEQSYLREVVFGTSPGSHSRPKAHSFIIVDSLF